MPFFVYILANRKNGALYLGVTNNISRRVFEHREKQSLGYTFRYGVHNLVYYEIHNTALEAITREKQMKKWKREWKIKRIREMNPDWKDLYLTLNQ